MLYSAIATFTSNSDFFEVLVYGIAFVFLILLLFITNKFLKVGIARRIRDQHTPFAMTGEDLDKLKGSGELTEEEWKRVKGAMARKFVERAKAEEAARSLPANAEVILAAAEESIKKGSGQAIVESAPPAPRQPLTRPVASPPPAPKPAPDALPEHLESLRRSNDLELDQLVMAGFLSEADAERVRRARQ